MSKDHHKLLKKIVIVDDDESLMEVYKVRLELEGFKVILKFNGEDALSFLKREKADLVILDCMLPKIGGIKVLEEVKRESKNSDTPIIMVSGLDRESYRRSAEDLGASDYLVKSSVSVSDMIARIEGLLG